MQKFHSYGRRGKESNWNDCSMYVRMEPHAIFFSFSVVLRGWKFSFASSKIASLGLKEKKFSIHFE